MHPLNKWKVMLIVGKLWLSRTSFNVMVRDILEESLSILSTITQGLFVVNTQPIFCAL